MKPFPNLTSIFQRIRLSFTSDLSLDIEQHPRFKRNYVLSEARVTVVLRLVNGVTVSRDGHDSIDYYDHSAPHRD